MKNHTHTHTRLNHFAIHQKEIQLCKSNLLPLKNKIKTIKNK